MSASESQAIPTSGDLTAQQIVWGARLLTHLRKPENLITYLVFSAWAKFMGLAEYIPSITIG